MSTTAADAPAISVVICTYNRPAMLRRAVESVLAGATRTGLAFEIVIADNSPQRYAAGLLAPLAERGVALRCVPAAPPNISIARNAGLRAARAPLVAFLDDDLTVAPGWLDAMAATLASSGADVVLGQLQPRFAAGGPPVWDQAAHQFTRRLEAPSGTTIVAGGPGRTPGFTVSTATSLWRAATCFTDPEPFDPAFGGSGGEDLDLFLRLERRGRRLAWCAEAVVEETIPVERSALRYNVLRAFSGAQAYAAATIRNSAAPVRTAGSIMLRGAVQTVLFAGLLVLQRPFGGWQRRLMAAAAGLGKLLWWRKLGLYQIERAPAIAR